MGLALSGWHFRVGTFGPPFLDQQNCHLLYIPAPEKELNTSKKSEAKTEPGKDDQKSEAKTSENDKSESSNKSKDDEDDKMAVD